MKFSLSEVSKEELKKEKQEKVKARISFLPLSNYSISSIVS
jgi:hypothetical protein